MIDRPWELHPAVVHFPIALLFTGFLLCAVARLPAKLRGGAGVESAVRFFLYLGTLFGWLAFLLGHIAEDTAPHVPAAWQVLEKHEQVATNAMILFTTLCVARFFMDRKKTAPKYEWVFLAGWLFAAGALVATGFFGGQLVFAFNVGTAATAP